MPRCAGHLDRVELPARDPQRRMRLLQRLRHDVAQREVEVLAVVLPAFLARTSASRTRTASSQTARLSRKRRSNGCSSVTCCPRRCPNSTRPWLTRSSVRYALGDTRRMVRRELDDAVTEPDASSCAGSPPRGTPPAPTSASTPRGSGARPPTRSRSRAGRRARSGRASVCSSSYSRSLVPRPRQLVLVEDAELHEPGVAACSLIPRAADRPGSSTARRGAARRRTRCGGPGTSARSSGPAGRRCRS